jgi:lysophospholipase L1-like esterase
VIAVISIFYWNRSTASAGEPESSTTVQPKYIGKLKFLALGDSYTIGESVAPSDRWPNQLAAQIRDGKIDLSDPLIIARTGWTTGDLLSAMDAAKLTDKYDLVMVLIGVNNQYQGRSEDEYRHQFVELLNRSIALADGKADRVVVLSIPDWGVTPFGRSSDAQQIAKEIDRFNAINREETKKTRAAYVDVTPASRQAATQPDLVADDGLHPSAKQYALWVAEATAAARSALVGNAR